MRRNTVSPTSQMIQNNPSEVFKRIHPQFFISEMEINNGNETWLQEMDESV